MPVLPLPMRGAAALELSNKFSRAERLLPQNGILRVDPPFQTAQFKIPLFSTWGKLRHLTGKKFQSRLRI